MFSFRRSKVMDVLFAANAPVFLFVPWAWILEGGPMPLTGVDIAFGKDNIDPTKYYVLGAAALAWAGVIAPNCKRCRC